MLHVAFMSREIQQFENKFKYACKFIESIFVINKLFFDNEQLFNYKRSIQKQKP